MTQPINVQVRQYKSRGSYESGIRDMAKRGYIVQSMSTTTSRRMLGCLFGIIGYWLLPKRTVFHVTFVTAPPPPPEIPV